MNTVEMVLIIIGVICIILSIVVGHKESETPSAEEISTELTKEQKEKIRNQVGQIIDEEIGGISEKTEAQLDKISNTKILEMNEYADNILGEISRNHNETVFLYDMLNEKAKEIKTTVKDVNNTKRQVEKIQAEVKTSENNNLDNNKPEPEVKPAADIPNTSSDDNISADKNTKDIAKERLMALVQKSNERGINEDGSLKRNSQADKLTNKQAEKQKDNKKQAEPVKTPTKQTKKTTKKKTEEKTDNNKTVQFDPGATNNEKILKLSEMNYSVKDIAKQLNLGIGEVKLVIDLYKGGK